MKLQQLTERAMQVLFHITRVDSAAQILQTGQFHLSASTGTQDKAQAPGHTWTPHHYFLSMSRSITSEYFIDMISPGSVVFVIAGDVLTQRNKIRPHVDQGAKEYLGDEYDEMEERLYSSKPVLALPKPLNRVIKSVHFMDLTNPRLLSQASGREESYASSEGFQALQAICTQNGIPFTIYKDLAKFRLLRAG